MVFKLVSKFMDNYIGRSDKKAFTMVELSIVLIVLGLLVAVVMAGTSLIQTAKLKAVIGEIESYKVAVDNFEGQYGALPGDIKNATSFWTTAQNGGTAVNNGNGDGQIGTGSVADYTEPYYAWNHLTLSKFVQGTFSGSSAATAIPGTNVPASKYMDGLGFAFEYASPWGYADALGRIVLNNYIYIGKADGATNGVGMDAFRAEDAYYIDSKIDDGTPDFGKVRGGHWNGSGTCTTGSAPNILYDPSITTVGCMITINISNN